MPEIEIRDSNLDSTFGDSNDQEIKTLECCDISYEDFFENFLLKNSPCVIKNVTTTWECTKNWIINDAINFEYIIEQYGHLEAPVADCNDVTFNAHCKTDMKVNEYMNYLKDTKRDKLLYLKDWHLRRVRPNDPFYEIPLIFASDWLNEFAKDRKEDDFMFVYIGPKDTWTPLHTDVYNSYSWSVNIMGKKKWIIFPPGEEQKLMDSLGNLPLWFCPEIFPDAKYFEIIQEKGDALFVPSGWHHQVVNLLDTISINHNWVNACNIEFIWSSFQNCLSSVENEIKDFKDTPEFLTQCQIILKSLFGMDFSNFIDFICYISNKRIRQLNGDNRIVFHNFQLGSNHIIFDLKRLFKIMNLIQDHYLFSEKLLSSDKEQQFLSTKNTISKILNK